MAIFIVAYDLVAEGSDRAPIEDAVHDLAYAFQLSESAYLVNVGDTAAQLLARFAEYVDRDDKLTVFEVTGAPVFSLPSEDREKLGRVIEAKVGDET